MRGHFDAQLAALDLVLDVATQRLPVSAAWLRELHARVCAAQQTYKANTQIGVQDQHLSHGEYKVESNSVVLAGGGVHVYASPLATPGEVTRLVDELGSDEFASSHPVLQAAYAHHALTAIHPFADGNGRTARALASVFLYRGAGVPLVVFADQQERYWDALAEADLGRFQSFATFIDERATDALLLVTDRLLEARGSLEARAAELMRRFGAHGGLSHGEVQAVGHRLFDHVLTRVQEYTNNLAVSPDVAVSVGGVSGHINCSFWDHPYHSLVVGGELRVQLMCQEPVKAQVQSVATLGVADDIENQFAFVFVDASRPALPILKLRLRDVHPTIGAAAEERIDGWVRQVLAVALEELGRGVDQALKGQGFSAR